MGPAFEDVYPIKMGIFQPAMLVYLACNLCFFHGPVGVTSVFTWKPNPLAVDKSDVRFADMENPQIAGFFHVRNLSSL